MINFTKTGRENQFLELATESVATVKDGKPGFIKVLSESELWEGAKKRGQALRESCEVIGIVGMGGSSLGAKALYEALGGKGNRILVFFDNVDAVSFEAKFQKVIESPKFHFLIVSKSGATMETQALTSHIAQRLKEREVSLDSVCTVISELKSNPLSDWARNHGVPLFEIPEYLGGRYSVLSPVGLIPAEFLGWSVDEMKTGACWALEQEQLVESFVSEALSSFHRNEWICQFWLYSDRLESFGDWIQQLWAESLGKRVRRSGGEAPRVSSPMICRGAADQHSVLQQLSEGARDKFVCIFSEVDSESWGAKLKTSLFSAQMSLEGESLGYLLRAEREGTYKALKDEGVSVCKLEIEEGLSPKVLGALFVTFELIVAALAESIDVDAYDQPGVEASKRLAREFLQS